MGAVCQRRTIVRASVIEAPEIQMRWYKQAEATGVSMSRKVPAEDGELLRLRKMPKSGCLRLYSGEGGR